MTPGQPPPDQAARDRARTDHTTVKNVEAGAGTGKTTLLTGCYLDLLTTEKATPAGIVAITFTEKAAQELRSRIRKDLGEAGLTEALAEIDRAPVSTIHAFAASLLRDRPIEADVDPDFEILDEIGHQLFLSEAFRKWLPMALEEHRNVFSRALSGGISLTQIETLSTDLYKHRDLYSSLELKRTSVDADGAFARISSEIGKLWAFAQSHCINEGDEGFRTLAHLNELVTHLASSPTEVRERALLLRLDVPTNKGNQKAWDSPASLKELKGHMAALQGEVNGIREILRGSIFTDLLSVLGSFLTFAAGEKRRLGKLEFDDLLILSRELLVRDPDVLLFFQERYQYFLVDEFQDTDPLQAEIIWLLCSKPGQTGPWRERSLEPGKLFLVGDPKQSIYRFRRADIQTYREAAGRVAAQGERLVIRKNFRSSAPLIEWFNGTFAKILGADHEPLLADADHATRGDQKPVILLECPDLAGTERARDIRLLEGEAIAALLVSMLKEETVQVWDRNTKTLRPLRAGDIAILFPTTTGIDLFEEQLRRYHLPFSLEGGRLFYARAEIHAALAGLEAVAHPTDAVAVVGALRSSLFGLSDQDLVEWIAAEQPFDYRRADPERLNETSRAAVTILRELHRERNDVLPSVLLRRLYGKTYAVPLTLARFHGDQAAANLDKLATVVRALEERGIRTIDPIVRWFRERSEAEERQDESPLFEEDAGRIRLLTVHKAKGLEFPVVVLANLAAAGDHIDAVYADRLHGRLALGIGRKDQGKFMTALYPEMDEEEKVQRGEERKRLLYVAATRARDLLILPRFLPKPGKSELWKLLDDALDPADPNVERRPADPLLSGKPPEEIQSPTSAEETGLVFMEVLEETLKKRAEKWISGLPLRSASRLVHAEDEPLKDAQFPAGASRGVKIGIAVHAALEKWDFRDEAQLERLARWAAADVGLPGIAEEVRKLLVSFAGSDLRKRILQAKRVFRELPFTYTKGDELFEGFVDLVLEEADGLVLVDFKTDRVGTEADVQTKADHYRPQIELYAEGLSQISNRSVKDRILFFVRPGTAVNLQETL